MTRIESDLDRILADFFKSQMKHPWPPAPLTPLATGWILKSEPSVLAAERAASLSSTGDAERGLAAAARSAQPSTHQDVGNKSRYRLAVSFVMLLGSCWCLSNVFQPSGRLGSDNPSPKVFGVFPAAGAENPAALKELRKDNAEKGKEGFDPLKIKLP